MEISGCNIKRNGRDSALHVPVFWDVHSPRNRIFPFCTVTSSPIPIRIWYRIILKRYKLSVESHPQVRKRMFTLRKRDSPEACAWTAGWKTRVFLRGRRAVSGTARNTVEPLIPIFHAGMRNNCEGHHLNSLLCDCLENRTNPVSSAQCKAPRSRVFRRRPRLLLLSSPFPYRRSSPCT